MHQAPREPMPWRGPAEVAAIEAALFESRQRQQARSAPATGGPMTDTNPNPSVARLRNIGNGMLREADELRTVGTDFLRWADEHEQQSSGPQHSAELPAERGAERGLPILNAAERAIANGTAAVPHTPPGQ